MPSFYRNSDATILVYDVTTLESFEKVQYWIDEVKSKVSQDMIMILVGNKNDLNESRQVTLVDGLECANKNEIMFMEVSAKSDFNISELFTLISKNIVERKVLQQEKSGIVTSGDNPSVIDSGNGKCHI